MRSTVALAALALAACAGQPQVISSNQANVVVRHDGSHADAVAVAGRQCASYGRKARLIHTEGWIMSFDCVQ